MGLCGHVNRDALTMANQESFQIRWRGIVSGPHGLEQLQEMLGGGEISLMHEALVDGRWVSLEELIQQKQKAAAPAKPTVAAQASTSRPSVDFIAGGPTAPQPPQRPVSPPPLPAEDLYYVARGGQQEGPYSKSVLRQLVAGGVLSPSDLIWKEGFPAWTELGRTIVDLPRSPVLPPTGISQPSGHTRPNPDLQDSELTQLFVGDKYPYYATKWQRAQENHRKYSWNWAAFFFGVGWMAYRKMYRNAWLILLAMISVRAIEVALILPYAATIVFWLALWLGFGLWSNRMYQVHMQKKLSAILSSSPSPEAARLRVACDGRTNSWGAIGIYLVMWLFMTCLELIETQISRNS